MKRFTTIAILLVSWVALADQKAQTTTYHVLWELVQGELRPR